MFLQVIINNVGDVFSRFAYFAWSAFPWYCRSKHWVKREAEPSFDGK